MMILFYLFRGTSDNMQKEIKLGQYRVSGFMRKIINRALSPKKFSEQEKLEVNQIRYGFLESMF